MKYRLSAMVFLYLILSYPINYRVMCTGVGIYRSNERVGPNAYMRGVSLAASPAALPIVGIAELVHQSYQTPIR